MADNKTLPPTGTGTANIVVATRTVTYSGETADIQVVGLATFSGSDDAKSVADVPAGVGSPTTAIRVVDATAATSTLANVAASASNVTLQASNANRLGWMFYNDSTSPVYVKLGATASATSFTVLVAAGGYYELPFRYTGIIDGIWVTATGNARVTEITA